MKSPEPAISGRPRHRIAGATPPENDPRLDRPSGATPSAALHCQLVADVGNTDTALGLLDLAGDRVLANWRVSTREPRSATEYRILLSALLEEALAPGKPLAESVLRRGVIASVVPRVTPILCDALAALVRGPVLEVTGESPLPISVAVENPAVVGADRVLNALAVWARFRRNAIAIDLGTATTFDCVTAEGVFIGGAIAPGPQAGPEWLAHGAPRLPRIELAPPAAVIGRHTEASLESGVFHSVIDALDGMVARIRKAWDADDPLVVATGGYSALLAPHAPSVHRIEPHLTLLGAGIAGAHLDRSGPSR